MIQSLGLTKRFGGRVLLDSVDFTLGRRERLGIVGRNGAGKSTLFKLILGEEAPDEGTLVIPRGYRVGHLAQHLEFYQPTILDEACLGLPEEERDQQYRGEIILAGLGFSQADMGRAPAEFSGGFQIRLNLAKLLLSEPNLLLLDEPTNYLDILSMRWLSRFLREWKGELMIISHDRAFMDSVTTHTMAIHRAKIRKVAGPTEKLYQQIATEEQIYEKTRVNENKKRKELEEFIVRFRAQASKASLVQSKVKMLERMGEKEELAEEQNLEFRFLNAPFEGKQMVDVSRLSFAYPGGPTLIKELSVMIRNGDRIGVIGKNGKGKSTLLKLIAGEIAPDTGSVSTHAVARLGYFGQTNISRLNPKLTVVEEIENANHELSRTATRAICGVMMFSGDDALKKVSVLSGGERSRVLLGRILAQPSNLLLLDEPTNHLDIPSIEALIEALRSYSGAVVIVTHGERILEQVCNRLIVFRGDTPEVIDGGYQEFLEQGGWGDDDDEMSKSNSASNGAPRPKGGKPPRRDNPQKRLTILQQKLSAAERGITKLEEEQRALESELTESGASMGVERMSEVSDRLAEIGAKIEEHFSEMEQVSQQIHEVSAEIRGGELEEQT